MKRSILINLSALAALLLYVASSVGINVHICDCTGHVCAHIALYIDNIHDSHHNCHHCSNEDACSHESHSHSCCHYIVYRVTIAGDNEDDGVQHINATSIQLPAYCCGLNVRMPDGIHCKLHTPDAPPPMVGRNGSISILRV